VNGRVSRKEMCGRHGPLASGRLPVVEGTGAVEQIHVVRYEFASRFVCGMNVLDVATGIGYGAHLLATVGKSASVTGVDVSEEALSAARERYGHPVLTFRLIAPGTLPFADDAFDVVVSFETVEHTADPGLFLSELRRVLRPGGPLIISTPNKRFHSFGRYSPWNPHHAFEMYPGQFLEFLTAGIGKPEFWGGQEFLPSTPGTIVRKNWIEFRYYRLLGRPFYNATHRLFSRFRPRIPSTGTFGSGGEKAGLEDCSTVVAWKEGREPYTMIAVCRKEGCRE
jgi:SAM-dependent methyltransferase